MRLIDWVIVALYCGALILVAWRFHSRAGRSVDSYFVADRKLPWWIIGLSDTAAYTGGGQAFLMVFFLGGFSGFWLMGWVSWVIWMPLVAVVWAKMWRRLGVVTTGELIERRYGGRTARLFRNVFAVYACTAWGLTLLAYAAAWMAASLGPLLGWPGGRVLLVFGAITLAYTLVSGLFGVAYNDALQFVLVVAGNGIFGSVLLARAGGLARAWDQIIALRGHDFLNPSPAAGNIGAISLAALCLQGLFFAGSPYAGEGWTAQRYMAAKNEFHAVMGQVLNGVLALVVRLIPFILIGLAAAALYTPSSVAVPAELWAQLVRRHAPAGLFGLLLVASLAGYMGSISAFMNWAAGYLVNDLYRLSLRPGASAGEYLLVSRLASGLMLVVAVIWALFIDPKQLDRWVLFINSALVVFPLPLAWLKWFWWRTNVFGEMVGILGAFPAGYTVWFGSDAVIPSAARAWVHRISGLNLDGIVPAFGDLNRFPFWAGFAIIFGLGWIAILTATLITRPESMDVLRKFYRDVQPIGFWGPVKAELPAEERESINARARSEIIACGWGVSCYFSMVLATFSALGGHFALAVLSGLLSLATGAMFIQSLVRPASRDTGQSARSVC
jgi:SSS family solute:Na+ symporter